MPGTGHASSHRSRISPRARVHTMAESPDETASSRAELPISRTLHGSRTPAPPDVVRAKLPAVV
ncbi:hypothetical protein GCM10010103_32180 [Streptomyces paradoxus]